MTRTEMEIKAQYYEFLSVRERVTLEGELIRLRPSLDPGLIDVNSAQNLHWLMGSS